MKIHDLALQLQSELKACCTRVEIAGSIRRGKQAPKDIEVVCIPKIQYQYDMFDGVADAHSEIDDWISDSVDWEFDPMLPRNGESYKRLRHIETKFPLDLFITDEKKWGVIFTIRTGPGDFSTALMTRALNLGMKVDGGRLYKVKRNGETSLISTPSEYDFFDALKIQYIEPEKRTVAALYDAYYESAKLQKT